MRKILKKTEVRHKVNVVSTLKIAIDANFNATPYSRMIEVNMCKPQLSFIVGRQGNKSDLRHG